MDNPTLTLWQLGAVGFLVCANGFFVAAEFALVTVRRTRIEQLALEGSRPAKTVRSALKHLDRYIAGTQVGITLASLALGWIGEPAFAGLIVPFFEGFESSLSAAAVHSIAVGIAFTVITFLHVILGELVPKSLALQKPEATALAVARPLKVAVALFQPLIWSLNGLGNLLLRAIGLKPAAGHEGVHSAQELQLLVHESHKAGVLDDFEKRMLQRTFRFSETTVAEIMIPRSEMVAFDITRPFHELMDLAAEATHSRIPIYEESRDHINGIVFVHELFRFVHQKQTDVRMIIRKPLFVPETLHLDSMIEMFRQNKKKLAVVVDEYGGTAGLVTLEDIIEAVIGEIQDQNESSPPKIRYEDDGTVILRGDNRLLELNETFGWHLESETADTIGGFIMEHLGQIPKIGNSITVGDKKFRVSAMDHYRITEIVVTK